MTAILVQVPAQFGYCGMSYERSVERRLCVGDRFFMRSFAIYFGKRGAFWFVTSCPVLWQARGILLDLSSCQKTTLYMGAIDGGVDEKGSQLPQGHACWLCF